MPLLALAALAPLLLVPASQPPRWPVTVERLMAADAAFYASDDFKRQLAKHRDRLMDGVTDAAAGETGGRRSEDHRAAAARGARHVAAMIRAHEPFSAVAYEVGGIVHELAAASPPPAATTETIAFDASKTSTFLGFPVEPFRDPELLVAARLRTVTAREAYDSTVTLATRLLAWIWKTAGGDASITKKYPETGRPYAIRE